ncbi:hypothetical protein JOF33_001231 [Corynebacterium freneyi]|uniref:Uncharacterized protein n=1 Tax=Corynebacterium freneyi TaxID=134034 RepID=A0ABS4U792_9CORY|nr:hypothetical protein [Corynebacterium freneyi]WJZ05362.1 hypothetical protein CFREN_06965 [Corynebacterium freneyi]
MAGSGSSAPAPVPVISVPSLKDRELFARSARPFELERQLM